MRRYRLTFAKGEAVRYISHLDLMRTWERILRRARLKLAHTQGFNPRPRLVFAAPLPVAVTSDAEIVDVVLEDDLTPAELDERLHLSLCPGISVTSIDEVPLDAPAVMACVDSADYRVEVAGDDLPGRVAAFLARESVPYERTRKGSTRQADMRASVLDVWVEGDAAIGMRLRLGVEGAAVRPEEVVAAIDPSWVVKRVHRTGLHLRQPEAAHAA
ncbi:MAG TPA: TIGR03936 family radical SAM-associated protein [Chloroflexota bacterium]|nr:TIGR03936 family radical SAM-associated protein [Chloroflexota bacterium]